MSVDCFEKAKAQWVLELKNSSSQGVIQTLAAEEEMFFDLCIGGVYESAGKDDLALNQYMLARNVKPKLSDDHPDRAFPYCGLGSVMY